MTKKEKATMSSMAAGKASGYGFNNIVPRFRAL
jgi:hypothetical protein